MQFENTPAPEDVDGRLSATRHPFWGWVDCGIVLGLLVGLIGLIFVMTAVATLIFPSLKTDQAPLLLSTQLAFYVAIYFDFLLVFRIRYDESVFFPLGSRCTVRSGTLLILGISGFLLSLAVNVMASLTHTPNVRMEVLNQLERQPIILALFGLMAVTITPLFEELVFRGFLQPVFSRTFGAVGGIVLTALLFGLLHLFQYKFVWQYSALVSFVGLVLGVVRDRTRSIIPSTVVHACYNAVFVTETFFHHK
jgi:membrane protease YdiL (CAAX protease family)